MQQHDVQEFCRVLFDAIEQSFEINNIFGVISDLYEGNGSDSISCTECNYESTHATKFFDLQLPVINEFENIKNDSIEKALFNYLHLDTLEGANAYHCPKCDKKVTATKGFKFVKLPKILYLQL